jgi:hypothetical protein
MPRGWEVFMGTRRITRAKKLQRKIQFPEFPFRKKVVVFENMAFPMLIFPWR